MTLDQAKCALGDLARPTAIYMIAAGCLRDLWAAPSIADKAGLLAVLTGGGTILLGLAVTRTVDNVNAAKVQGEVDKVKAAASGGTQP